MGDPDHPDGELNENSGLFSWVVPKSLAKSGGTHYLVFQSTDRFGRESGELQLFITVTGGMR